MPPTLSLQVQPNWDEVDVVREKTAAFLKKNGLTAPAVDAVSMVTCELTENAVKYGHYCGEVGHLEVGLRFSTGTVTVEVRSPVPEEDEANLERLDRMVQWIRGFQDPFEAYLERLKEVSSQSLNHAESGLGLVRIAYEGQSVIDFYVDDQHILAVSAVYHA